MNSDIQPRIQAMQQHARPACVLNRSHLLQRLRHARQTNIESRHSTVSRNVQPAQRLRKAPPPAHQTS